MKEKNIQTTDINVPNNKIEILRRHFGKCFDKNGNFNYEKFKDEITGYDLELSKESYSIEWLGKSYSRMLVGDSARTLLVEDELFNAEDENKLSQNLLLKGDNFEVLKHLSNAYSGKIKTIYIDPPYNTGNDGFVYEDDRKFTVKEIKELANVDDEKANRILEFTQSKSNSHSAWLSFIYPRLYIAAELLCDDGVIFVSIDDNEIAQLKILMDEEIFGPENFIDIFSWTKSETPANLSKKSKKTIEYVLCYQKVRNSEKFTGIKKSSKSSNGLLNQTNSVSTLKFPAKKVTTSLKDQKIKKGKYGTDSYDIHLLKDTEVKKGVFIKPVELKAKFKWSQNKLDSELKNGTVINIPTIKLSPSYEKQEYDAEVPPNLINSKVGVGTNENAGTELEELMGAKVFSFPKPPSLIKYLLKFSDDPNGIILDFFAGSGTTADAVMQLNAEDNGSRRFILVQLPELLDEKTTAYNFAKNKLKVEKPTIFDITKERIIRSASKIKKDNPKLKNQDLGFKIFETMPIWEDYGLESEELTKQTKLFDESKLTEDDTKALLTTWKTYDGADLAKNYTDVDLDGYTSFYANEKLYLMNKGFKTKSLKALLEKIDSDKSFEPKSIVAFGYHFDSKDLREIAENIKAYKNKKGLDIDFITRY